LAPELSRQIDDILGQPFFIRQSAGHLALRRAMLSECPPQVQAARRHPLRQVAFIKMVIDSQFSGKPYIEG
jgi:ureidoglycolate hydrolase